MTEGYFNYPNTLAVNNPAPIAVGSASGEKQPEHSLSIGKNAWATADYSIAIGTDAKATADHSIAIGANAKATHSHAVVLGYDAQSTMENEISIGDIKIINGELVIGETMKIYAKEIVCHICGSDERGTLSWEDDVSASTICFRCIFDCVIAYKAKAAWEERNPRNLHKEIDELQLNMKRLLENHISS